MRQERTAAHKLVHKEVQRLMVAPGEADELVRLCERALVPSAPPRPTRTVHETRQERRTAHPCSDLDEVVQERLQVSDAVAQFARVGDGVDRRVKNGNAGVQQAWRVGLQRNGQNLLTVTEAVVGPAIVASPLLARLDCN